MPSGDSGPGSLTAPGLRLRQVPLWLTAVLATAMAVLPVLRDFSYEYAVLWSLLFFLFSAFRNGKTKTPSVTVLLLFAIPLAIGFVPSAARSLGAALHGLCFYLLLVLPALMAGMAITAITAALAPRTRFTLRLFLVLALLLPPVVELYGNPQIYFYNTVIGFFPGTIYDEYIPLTWRLVLWRLAVLLVSGAIVAGAPRLQMLIAKRRLAAYAAIAGLLAASAGCSLLLGYGTTVGRTESVLSTVIEQGGVRCYFSPAVPAARRKLIAAYAAYSAEQVAAEFGVTQKSIFKLYVYRDEEQKAELYGTGNADMAKPWQHTAFITANSQPETIRHEIAHLAAAEFGSGIFLVAAGLNPALIEGVAVAAAPWYSGIDNDSLAAFGLAAGLLPEPAAVFSGLSFFAGASGKAYTIAGAFCAFISAKYGKPALRNFYTTGNLNASGVTFAQAGERFKRNFTVAPDSLRNALAALLFARPGFIEKQFPRYTAYLYAKAETDLAEGKFAAAERIFRKILQLEQSPRAVLGLAAVLRQAGKAAEAVALLSPFTTLATAPQTRFAALLALADAQVVAGDTSGARPHYSAIVKYAALPQYRAAADFRIWLLDHKAAAGYLAAHPSDRLQLLCRFTPEQLPLYALLLLVNSLSDSAPAKNVTLPGVVEAALGQINAISVSLASIKSNAALLPGNWLADWYLLQFSAGCLNAAQPVLALQCATASTGVPSVYASALNEYAGFLKNFLRTQ